MPIAHRDDRDETGISTAHALEITLGEAKSRWLMAGREPDLTTSPASMADPQILRWPDDAGGSKGGDTAAGQGPGTCPVHQRAPETLE